MRRWLAPDNTYHIAITEKMNPALRANEGVLKAHAAGACHPHDVRPKPRSQLRHTFENLKEQNNVDHHTHRTPLR